MPRFILVILVVAVIHPAEGQVPRTLSYQGVLTDSLGNPKPDGTYTFTFRLYNVPAGGAALWSEQKTLAVERGLFYTTLGDQVLIGGGLTFDEPYWLGIQVASGLELIPRLSLTPVGLSLFSMVADTAWHAVRADTARYALIAPAQSFVDSARIAGTIPGGPFLQLSGGALTGAITNTGDPPITMGQGNFGIGNLNTGTQAFVAGSNNMARGAYSVVGGGGGVALSDSNSATGDYSTVGGGRSNRSTHLYSTVGGGLLNTAGDNYATVGGGYGNTADQTATVSGGYNNTAIELAATVGGGRDNIASGQIATVGGGAANTASELSATVGGGRNNIASGQVATVGGGLANTASALYATVGGGRTNTASGQFSTVPGGDGNSAAAWAFAAGNGAKARHQGAVVIAANALGTPGDSVASGGGEQMVLRADGGIYVTNASGTAPNLPSRLINTSSGAYLTTGGVWTNASDRNLKENFQPVNAEELLKRFANLPISQWNYKNESSAVRHIGPTAQDFYAAFGLGDDDKSLSTIDPAGIALAAIQELHRQNQKLTERVAALESEIMSLTSAKYPSALPESADRQSLENE